jgi:hypothetical protein
MTMLAKATSNLTDRQLEASRELIAEVGGWQLEVSPAQKLAANSRKYQLKPAIRV